MVLTDENGFDSKMFESSSKMLNSGKSQLMVNRLGLCFTTV